MYYYKPILLYIVYAFLIFTLFFLLFWGEISIRVYLTHLSAICPSNVVEGSPSRN